MFLNQLNVLVEEVSAVNPSSASEEEDDEEVLSMLCPVLSLSVCAYVRMCVVCLCVLSHQIGHSRGSSTTGFFSLSDDVWSSSSDDEQLPVAIAFSSYAFPTDDVLHEFVFVGDLFWGVIFRPLLCNNVRELT